MPRAHFIVLLLVTLCLLCSASGVSGATVWDETYDTAKIFKAKQDINIRSSPSKGGAVLGVMKRGQTATVPALVKGWYKVILPDGTTGYIYKRFLEHVPGAQPPTAATAPEPVKAPEPAATSPEPAPEPVVSPEPAPAPVEAAPVPAVQPAPAPEPEPAPAPATPQPEQKTQPAPAEPQQPVPAAPEKTAAPQQAPAIQVPAELAPEASSGVDCIRIKFKNNALTGTAEYSVSKGGHDCYEVNLEKSQWMEVWLTSPEDAAMFEIFSPTGDTLCSREIHWLGRSEQAGEYIIFVSQDSGSGPYKLRVQVK